MDAEMSAEDFEEHVRKQCVRIMRAVQHGQPEQAGTIAAELCSLAAGRKRGREMSAEAGADYDLAALHALPMSAPEAGE